MTFPIPNISDASKRFRSLLPPSWFPDGVGTNIDGLVQGFANVLAWARALIIFARNQVRLLQASGVFIDLWSYDYLGLTTLRRPNESDSAYATRVQSEVLRERVTRSGMAKAITDLTGRAPVIMEPWNTSDCGAWSGRTSSVLNNRWGWATTGGSLNLPRGTPLPSYGARALPNQVFMIVYRGPSIAPGSVAGWASRTSPWTPAAAGFAGRVAPSWKGTMQWISRAQVGVAITDAQIYAAINRTKPVGVTVWVHLI